MRLTLTPLAPALVPVLPFDIAWGNVAGGVFGGNAANEGVVGDFAIETDPAKQGVGGYTQRSPIASAVLMLLFSDARCTLADLKRLGLGGDRRGWPGDGFDVQTQNGEAPLGGFLWTLRRTNLTDASPPLIAAAARQALSPLLVQQACAEINTSATILNRALGNVALAVEVIGRDGAKVYAGKFGPLWARPGFDGAGGV